MYNPREYRLKKPYFTKETGQQQALYQEEWGTDNQESFLNPVFMPIPICINQAVIVFNGP